jgi:TolB-like protein/tetratricopeptide (TPR) repeat protein
MQNLIAEMRRRNVLRVATAYALVAWIIIEAGSVLLPTFGASEQFFQLYVIAVIAGFIVAIVLAWVFEWTPEGVRLDRNVDRTDPRPVRSAQKSNYVIIGLLAVALAVSITFNVTGIRQDAMPDPASGRSIAVLPFTSLSNDPDNELFADGIHDDLLTKIGGIKSLTVISRPSVMAYRNSNASLRKIASDLGVETILNGTVQRVGDNVRVNLQLIDPETDRRLWTESYDRRLSAQNIFSIQSEISGAVANALKATLTREEQVRIATMPTRDLRAYRLYKEGKSNIYRRQRDAILAAREQFNEAAALDPGYAEAYAGIAESNLLLFINHAFMPASEAIAITELNLDRALELNPELAEAHAIRGLLKSTLWSKTRVGDGNIEAEASFRRAIELNPNLVSAYMWFASLRDSEERLDEAISLYQKSLELDPLGRIPYSNLPLIYAKRGEADEAMKLWLEAVRIHSEWPTIYEYISVQLWGLGRLDEAFAWNQMAMQLGDDPTIGGNMNIGIMFEFGELERALAEIDKMTEDHPFFELGAAFRVLLEGRFAEAHTLFVEAIDSERLPASVLYTLASDTALLAGNLPAAKLYTLQANPILTTDAELKIDRTNARDVVKLAYIEQRQGHGARAAVMLDAALEGMREWPRLGTFGYGIRDVQIFALLGRTEDAINAFREALDQGFRSSLIFDGWPLAADPYIDSIRSDPRFLQMQAELDSYIEAMHQSLLDAEYSGSLDELRARVDIT